MDRETAAVVANAHALSKWAASAVVETDRLIALSSAGHPPPNDVWLAHLRVHRELLVRLSQRESLVEWAVSIWRTPEWRWWQRAYLRIRGPRK